MPVKERHRTVEGTRRKRRSMPSTPLTLALSLTAALLATPVAAPAATPRGFTVADSGELGSQAGRQTHGSVDCPPGKVPLGGGVVTALFSSQTINSSYP